MRKGRNDAPPVGLAQYFLSTPQPPLVSGLLLSQIWAPHHLIDSPTYRQRGRLIAAVQKVVREVAHDYGAVATLDVIRMRPNDKTGF